MMNTEFTLYEFCHKVDGRSHTIEKKQCTNFSIIDPRFTIFAVRDGGRLTFRNRILT